MKKYILFILIMAAIGCNNNQPTSHKVDFSNTNQLNEPKILDELLSSERKYGRSNLVDHLYGEALKSDPKLKALDSKISKMNGVKNEGFKDYNEFVKYNNSFYSSADRYLNSIQDTVKRDAIRNILLQSQEKLNSEILTHKKLSKTANDLERELNDQLVLMKLVISEKLVNSYQNNIPSLKEINAVNEQYEDLILESDKYIDTQE